MPKPVLMTVDDDPDVLRAVERDLRRRYGAKYRVLRADSGETALDALHAHSAPSTESKFPELTPFITRT